MSHCTKFDFQFTDAGLIRKTFGSLGLKCEKDKVYSYASSYDKSIGNYNAVYDALIAKKNGFNYFMEDRGNHYELFIEKHNMSYSEERISKEMAEEFKKEYIHEAAKEVVQKMQEQGQLVEMTETDAGYEIRFGLMYDKCILIKFSNGRVIEEVQGVKGKSCVSLTEALENMLSSADVELDSEWTSEYYEEDEEALEVYNMEHA